MKKNRYAMYAVLLCNLVQMAMLGITPMLSMLPGIFPEKSVTALQLLVTFPNLVVVFVSLASGKIAEKIQKKRLMQLACGSFLVVAAGGYFFHDNIGILFFWSALMGLGVGIIISIGSSLCSDLLEGEERSRMLGYQSVVVAIGGVILSAAGGRLSSVRWYDAYLVYLAAIPGLLMVTWRLPEGIYAGASKKDVGTIRITPKIILPYAGIAFAALSFCNAVPTNISLYLLEIGIKDTTVSGIAAAVMQAGGAAAGFAFGLYFKKLGERLFPIAFASLAAGLLCILTGEIALIMVGMFLTGYCMTTVMVCCSNGVTVNERREAVTLGLAVLMAAGNTGGFLASFYTDISRWVFKSGMTYWRFVLIGALAAGMMALTLLRCIRIRQSK